MTTAAIGVRRPGSLPGPLAATGRFLRTLARRPVGLVGLIGVVFFVLLAFVGPLLVPLQETSDVTAVYVTPSAAHPLGTDFRGRDVLNQIVWGGRDILAVALLAATFSTLIAVTLGALAASIGGRVDALIVGIADVALTVPHLIVLIVVAAILRPTGFVALAVVLAALQWSGLLRPVRAQVLSLREREYVEAARSLDLGMFHIIFREMLPNMRSYIVIHFILAMTGAIYAVTGIVYLGLVPISGQSWAIMLYLAQIQGAIFFRDSFWFILSPILAIALFQLSLVSLVSALEDIFNPRLRNG